MATISSLNSLHLHPHKPTSSFPSLAAHLSSSNFRLADHETRSLLLSLAGQPALNRGYLFFSELQFISPHHLRAIDHLWLSHSHGRLGYSVQRRVWDKASRDFTKFFIDVGWMRRMDESEVEQFTYRSFPDEFVWEMSEEMKDGHLPLTNALRGTQLLASILLHPAFEVGDEVDDDDDVGLSSRRLVKKKPDYSF